jgi:hypothetical protein
LKKQKLYGLLVLIIALVAIIWYVSGPKKISTTEQFGVAPETIGGVGIDGLGGDVMLNREKNRFSAPTTPRDFTPTDLIRIPSELLAGAGRRHRQNWPGNAIAYANQEEELGVRLTGYLVHAKQSGPESCNGYSDSLRDYHIWVSDTPTDDKSRGVIVEITPRFKAVHPEWRLHYLEQLADRHARVRVTGWLMWDEEHPDEVGKSRATQWEVHPVTNFEIESAGQWRQLTGERLLGYEQENFFSSPLLGLYLFWNIDRRLFRSYGSFDTRSAKTTDDRAYRL